MLDVQTVSKGLLAMSYACRAQRAEDVNGAMAAVWLDAMRRNGVTPQEFGDRCKAVVDSAAFFPSVGEFLKPVLAAKPSSAQILDPVVTGVNAHGVVVIESKSLLRPGQRSLPAGTPPGQAMASFGVARALPAPTPEQAEREARQSRRVPVDAGEIARLAEAKRL